jgi:hypothetical protein
LAILDGAFGIHHVCRLVQVVMLRSRPPTAELKIKEREVMLRSKPLTAEPKIKERRNMD